MVRDRPVGVVDVDVVRNRLARVVVLEPVVVDDRLAADDHGRSLRVHYMLLPFRVRVKVC